MLNKDLVRQLERAVDEITNHYDETFCENLNDYEYLLEDQDEQIIKDFESNYSSRGLGFVDNDELDGAEVIAAFRDRRFTDSDIVRVLLGAAECEPCDIYIHYNEIASVSIGEYEHQIDVEGHPELKDLIAAATDEELKAARIEDRDSFYAYGNPCDRIIWKVDPKIVLEKLNAVKPRAKLSLVPKQA